MLVIPGIPPDNFWICFNMCCSYSSWKLGRQKGLLSQISCVKLVPKQSTSRLSMAKLWSSMTNYDIHALAWSKVWPKPEHPMSKLRFYVTLRKNHDFLWPNHGSLRKFPEISKDACFHLHNQAIGVTSGQW